MTIADELRAVAEEQNRDAELPDLLLAELLNLADNSQLMACEEEVRRLISLLKEFDIYAGTGCFSEASSVRDIEHAIALLRQKGTL